LAANIGLTPVAQGMPIRCTIPEMSGERRKELVKVAITIHAIRRDIIETFKNCKKMAH
jgi:ribosome recycling factor